jgi:hypothetical protein
MRFKDDKQRRAMFARISRAGVSLGPAEVDFKSSSYGPIRITGVKEIDLSPTSESVPDWVGVSNSPVVEETTISTSTEPDYLSQYAKNIKSADSSISIGEDKSNVNKQVDDFLLQYASTVQPEKKHVGAVRTDDEYKGEATELIVRGGNRKKLKELDEVFNLHSRGPVNKINIKEVDGKLSMNLDGKTKIIDVPIGDDIYLNNLQWKTITKLNEGFRLNEFDLSHDEKRRLKELFEDAV